MATYEWVAEGHVMDYPRFNSFVEDWDRSHGATGHLHRRAAVFYNTTIKDVKTGKEYKAGQERFSSSQGEFDKFAKDKVEQVKHAVIMSTGAPDQLTK